MTTKTPQKPPKKPRDEAVGIMLGELRGMTRSIIVCNAVALLGIAVYCIVVGFHWRLLTGLLFGNAATILNFYHLGVKAGNIARMKLKDVRRARVYATTSFFIRYFGAFAAFGVLIHFGFVNAVTALMPLFYPKIHYTFKAIRHKEI
jgi:hypothetical protein